MAGGGATNGKSSNLFDTGGSADWRQGAIITREAKVHTEEPKERTQKWTRIGPEQVGKIRQRAGPTPSAISDSYPSHRVRGKARSSHRGAQKRECAPSGPFQLRNSRKYERERKGRATKKGRSPRGEELPRDISQKSQQRKGKF